MLNVQHIKMDNGDSYKFLYMGYVKPWKKHTLRQRNPIKESRCILMCCNFKSRSDCVFYASAPAGAFFI